MIRRSRRTTRTATLFPYTTLFRSGFRARRAGAMVPPMTSLEPIPGPIHVIGGGLAGSEAAWQIARAGVPVVLHEMRPLRATEAHVTDGLAELVCSRSEEHTSELQSLMRISYAGFCLKKKTQE